ncbi:hypothetical protein CKM354_001008300 [Cercospora kikuchii]|uniref:DUF952 domain-containing protein n=1 Tax=Cercospora kikuchii TaxID=84275 RepID=A0A9P3FGY4_9PEZI|nr:uncharacterized protein CKM354_001008300 [Cercospora kikuchii]GIZ46981.1 hypothetical protein CKM354_001008300 [Cercospora kikuchii]
MSSSSPSNSKTYFYKILDSPPPSPLPETLPATPLDIKDNFIHLSTATQIPITADLFFASHTKLWLLKLRIADLDGEIRYVEGLPECPHVHDSVKGLGKGNVEEVILVERRKGEKWGALEALRKLES